MHTQSYTTNTTGTQHIAVDVGDIMPANVDTIRRRMVEQRTPPERQVQQWLALWRRWPDSDWGAQCLSEAERILSLLQREHDIQVQLANLSPQPAPTPLFYPPSALAERHFVWLGDRHGLQTEQLRNGIASLSRLGMIGQSREQQDALRRGLGLTVNDDERRSDAPRVRWLGPSDMLWLLVEGLWQRQLITCAGGRQQKWRTAIGIFLHADGKPFDLTLKNSRCYNEEKRAVMRRSLFDPLSIAHQSATDTRSLAL